MEPSRSLDEDIESDSEFDIRQLEQYCEAPKDVEHDLDIKHVMEQVIKEVIEQPLEKLAEEHADPPGGDGNFGHNQDG